jgi:hypothetical protein
MRREKTYMGLLCTAWLACHAGFSGCGSQAEAEDATAEDHVDVPVDVPAEGEQPGDSAVDEGPGDPPAEDAGVEDPGMEDGTDEEDAVDSVEEPSCPSGAVCFEEPGLFHEPTEGSEVRRLTYTPPDGTYGSMELELDVFHGGWSVDPDAIRHNIFWLAHNARNFDLYGYVNFEKPSTLHLVHGMGMVHVDKPKLRGSADLAPDALYHVHYLYDAAGSLIDLTVTRAGTEVGRITTEPNIDVIVLNAGDFLAIDFGFGIDPDTGLPINPAEPPTYGWRYMNLKLTLYP